MTPPPTITVTRPRTYCEASFFTRNPGARALEVSDAAVLLVLAAGDAYRIFEIRTRSGEYLQFVRSFTTEEEARRVWRAGYAGGE